MRIVTALDTDDVRPSTLQRQPIQMRLPLVTSSNLTIATEHRGITYENTFDIYMSGYDTQKIIKTFNISELSIPPISQ